MNNLTFGLDHKIYGSSSHNGGKIRRADDPTARAVDIEHADFRFDPETLAFEAVTGTVQFGNTFDDLGNRFLCSESQPLLHAVLPLENLSRNPYLPVPQAISERRRQSGADLPDQPARALAADPVEPSDRARRALGRIGGRQPSRRRRGAGVTIYRGSAYPEDFCGNAFVGDAQNNLIHRMKLMPDGPTFKATSVDGNTEFVRSSDNWFRPVNLVNAPDGTLYVLDMSREVIEAIHIPLDVVKHLDLRRGRDQGRIYRIAPTGFAPRKPPHLSNATTAELVATLEHPDGWWRDTAHRLLFERQDAGAVGQLRTLVASAKSDVARVHVLWSLHGLKALTDEVLMKALSDPSPRVVEHAVRLAEPRLARSPTLVERVAALADHDDVRVKFQAALSLGATSEPRALDALATIARRDASDTWTRLAVLASAGDSADLLFARLANSPAFRANETGVSFLEQLAGVVGARNRTGEIARVLGILAALGQDPTLVRRLVLGLGRGMSRSGGHFALSGQSLTPANRLIVHSLDRAALEAANEQAGEAARLQAIAILGCAPLERSREVLATLLDPRHPKPLQLAALHALAGYSEPEVAALVLERDRALVPAVRAEVIDTLLSREPWTLALFRAAKDGRADVSQVDPARRTMLMKHRNCELAALARDVFSRAAPASSPDKDVLAAFAPAAKMSSDARRGSEVFGKLCATCHRVGDRGHSVGPDLTATQFREPDALMTHILEPNRFVPPNYVQYLVSDRSGRVFSGLIASETPSSLTLRRAEGAEDTILRSQIEELASTGKSLMPENFATKLTHQEMADLIAYLLSAHRGTPESGRLEIGTEAGAIEPEN